MSDDSAVSDEFVTIAEAAPAVDRQRGWLAVDRESVGLAESVEQLAIGMGCDIHPPQGRD